jgi:hypothetical protein
MMEARDFSIYSFAMGFIAVFLMMFVSAVWTMCLYRRRHRIINFIPARLIYPLRRFWFSDSFCLQVVFGGVSVMVGLFVMVPFHTTTPPFTILSYTLPEWAWGLIWFYMGALQMYAAYHERVHKLKELSSLLGVFFWAFLLQVTVNSQPNTVAIVLYTTKTLVWAWVWWNCPDNTIAVWMDSLQDFVCQKWQLLCKHV